MANAVEKRGWCVDQLVHMLHFDSMAFLAYRQAVSCGACTLRYSLHFPSCMALTLPVATCPVVLNTDTTVQGVSAVLYQHSALLAAMATDQVPLTRLWIAPWDWSWVLQIAHNALGQCSTTFEPPAVP
jgi:hypothetical protein